jgi:hypothetical protein
MHKRGLIDGKSDSVRAPLPPGYPTETTTYPNNYAAGLNGNGPIIGPGITPKVMAGNQLRKPRAFVTWALFDNQLNYVAASSGFDQVGSDQEFKKHVLPNLQVAESGYLYIYSSN